MLRIGRLNLSTNYRAPGLPYKIHHPHVVDKSWATEAPNREVVSSGLAKYFPKNWRMQQFVESVRTGEFLGKDYPYNLLPMKFWQNRRYNVEHKQVPDNVSLVPRVDFYARLNVWAVAWKENGREYHRWFRVQVQGFEAAKRKAEAFQRMLAASGRIEGKQLESAARRRKLSQQEYLAERDKRIKKFARTRLIRRGLF
jgi:hypothetical protein